MLQKNRICERVIIEDDSRCSDKYGLDNSSYHSTAYYHDTHILYLHTKATSYSKGMDMMNSDSSISMYDNYRLSMTSKDKAKDKVYCYSTKVSSTGHFDIICTEAKREELAATPSSL